MSETAPLARFISALLPGDEQAIQAAELAASGDGEAIQRMMAALDGPAFEAQQRPFTGSDLMRTYLLSSAELRFARGVRDEGASHWYSEFAGLLQHKGGPVMDRSRRDEVALDAAYPAVMPLIAHFQPLFLDTDHSLMALDMAFDQWVFVALTPHVARCWDGIAVPVGATQWVVTSALDKAEPYILSARPDLAMLLRGLPPRLAQPGDTCPAIPGLQ